MTVYRYVPGRSNLMGFAKDRSPDNDNDEYVKAFDYDALAAKLAAYKAEQHQNQLDLIEQRDARKAFEKRYTNVVTSSWDGDTSSIGPMAKGPRPEDGYWGVEDNRRWQTYVIVRWVCSQSKTGDKP